MKNNELLNIGKLSKKMCGAMKQNFPVFTRHCSDILLPSKNEILKITEMLRSVLFPGFFGEESASAGILTFNTASILDKIYRSISKQIQAGFCFICNERQEKCCNFKNCEEKADTITTNFLKMLPYIQELLIEDSISAYENDPAATSIEECIFSYPGILAITNYRIAHALYHFQVPIIPRIITEQAHAKTGIDIHPGAEIGKKFFIDHGTGVVIGGTCIIGNNCKLYQGVTLGAKSFSKDDDGNIVKGVPRHPILEDDVTIYSQTSILGRITIGKGAVIGGNLWITKDVPAGSTITLKNFENGKI